MRFSNPSAVRAASVSCAVISISDVLLTAVKKRPGAKVTNVVKVPARSRDVRLALFLTKTESAGILDVAPTDPKAVITLRMPNGIAVTKETAKSKGIAWEATKWPPEDMGGDDSGFGTIIMMAVMLPVEGTHQVIGFEEGVLQNGRYVIEVDASGSDHPSEVSAMFLTEENLEKEMNEGLGLAPPKPGETRAKGYGEDETVPPFPKHFVGDKIHLKLELEGAPVREPLHFRSFAYVTEGMLSEGPRTEKETELKIDFIRGADGTYSAVFTPEEHGTYDVCTEVKGTQKTGRAFTSKACFGSYIVQPLVARLKGLTELAKADRLEVNAALEVFEPGEYEYTFQMKDGKNGSISDSGKVMLEAGSRVITGVFQAATLAEQMNTDGPYTVTVYSLGRVVNRTLRNWADLRAGDTLTTAPYRRDDWDRGNFHATTRVRGEGVDLKGNGKFQIYRVKWDVVTPGGSCNWSGNFLPDKVYPFNNPINGRASLAPGVTTIETDVDGYWMKQTPGDHAWNFDVYFFQCDGKSFPSNGNYKLLRYSTPVLHAEDFEALATDFRLRPTHTEFRTWAAGPHVWTSIFIEPVGQFKGDVQLRLSGVSDKLKIKLDNPRQQPGERFGAIDVYVPESAKPGEYPIQVIATSGMMEHSVTLRLVVEEHVTAVASAVRPVAKGRSIVLIASTSASMGPFCDSTSQMVRQLAEKLRPGQDRLSIIRFAPSVEVLMPMTANLSTGLRESLDKLSQVKCGGPSNMAYAIEQAREQLVAPELKDSDRVMVLFASGLPTAITASWPVRTESDSRMELGTERVLKPSGCEDNQGRRYPQPEWATGISMPDRVGVLTAFNGMGMSGPLRSPASEISPQTVNNGCGFFGGPLLQDLAYLPETDLGGMSLAEPQSVVRFETGPYRGKIRPDSVPNVHTAAANLAYNALQSLAKDGIRVVLVWLNTSAEPPVLNDALNLPGNRSFDASKPVAMVVTVHDRDQVARSTEQILLAALGAK